MHTVQSGPVVGPIALLTLLGALAATVGLSGLGWVAGIGSGVVTYAALARAVVRTGAVSLGPADRVTLTRATLVSGVGALVADSFTGPASVMVLVTLAAVALALDAVDGWVARRTHTASALGARFDMEVDAFLILVLSVYVAGSIGAWMLAIGAARYAFVAAGWLLPWLRGAMPQSYWRKLVAAVQGVVLTFSAADVLPRSVAEAALGAALALLMVSFGSEAWYLWRHRLGEPGPDVRRVRTVAAVMTSALAGLLVWIALLAPNEIGRLTPGAFVRIPLEGLPLVILALVLPPRGRRIAAATFGVVLGALTINKILDMGFIEVLDRPFDSIVDWRYLGSAVGVVDNSIGRAAAIGVVAAACLLSLAILILMPWAVLRFTRTIARHPQRSWRAGAAGGTVWILCAAFGVHAGPGVPIASVDTADYAYGQVSRIPSEIRDQRIFARAAVNDPLRNVPADKLLTGLRGKDVIFAFVESYGRIAVQGSSFSRGVSSVLASGTQRLHASGFSARSAFLTSPTFGAVSWLAHSTLQSGLWVDSQQRYDALVTSNRHTLSHTFKRAGWRTVGDVPANTHHWPQGAFYDYDKIYDSRNVGYAGPRFGYPTMPDQYTLDAFHRLELSTSHRKPVMAEIDLISSHAPWSRTPHMIDQSKVGDGSVFQGMPERSPSEKTVWRSPRSVRDAYAESIRYSLDALFTFVQTYGDDNLVLIVLGDHQPATIVSGRGASHDVPISIIARDPAVLDRTAGWGWQDGMTPDPHAPVWRMDAFRDRFLSAYGPQPPALTRLAGQRG